ncbi:hypothetical protein GmHk_11G032096 [Glycine max]|nr:hypothetical protein GmHk_11G032096 [Glycine max]
MLSILGKHGWVGRSTRKSLRLICSSLCTGVCTNVLYVSIYHRLIGSYHRYHWLIIDNSDRHQLLACRCDRTSPLGSTIRIIMIPSAKTSVNNPT